MTIMVDSVPALLYVNDMPTKPPNPTDIQDLAVRPMVMSDIQAYLRSRRRQAKGWESTNLFGDEADLAIRKSDHPMVQVAKRTAAEYLAADEAQRAKYLAELSKLVISIEKELGGHFRHLINVCLDAAKVGLRQAGRGSGADLSTLTTDELVQHLIETEGVSEDEARELVSLATSDPGADHAG